MPSPVADEHAERGTGGRHRPRPAAPGASRSIFDSTKSCGRSARPPPCSASSRSIASWRRATSLGVRAGLDQVDQQPRPLEVGEELVAEADARARPLEQAGDVGDRQLAAVVGLDRAEHRLDGRERVVGHLRPGVRDPAQERRLAGVREARAAPRRRPASAAARATARRPAPPPGPSRAPGGGPSRSAGCRRRRRRRRATVTRARRVGQVGDQLVGVADPHLRADRDPQLEPVAAAAVPCPRPCRACRAASGSATPAGTATGRAGRGRRPARRRRRRRRHRRPGPPLGTYFSRRKLTQPSPPRPACT